MIRVRFNRSNAYSVILIGVVMLLLLTPQFLRADELGRTWTIRSAPSGLGEVVYGAGKFVALGGGKLATSPDGVTWSEQTPPAGTAWRASIFAQGKFVALSGEDSEEFPTNVMTSSDGLNWTLSSDGLMPGSLWGSIAYGNGTFVAGAVGTFSLTHMAVSSDAVTWTPVSLLVGSPGIVDLAFGDGAFVAVQTSNGLFDVRSILRSTNGTDWQEQKLPSGASPELHGVTFGRSQFVAVGENTTIITSPDGITWVNRAEPGNATLVEVIDAGEQYIAFGYDNSSLVSVILTSPDGVTWTRQSSPSTLSRISAAYAHGVVVAFSALQSLTETVITSGAFKISTDVVFRRGSATLSDEAKAILVNSLVELDNTRRVRLALQIQTTRAPRAVLLARRRLSAISRYVRSQRPSQLLVRSTLRLVNRVRVAQRDRVSAAFRYQ